MRHKKILEKSVWYVLECKISRNCRYTFEKKVSVFLGKILGQKFYGSLRGIIIEKFWKL